MQRSRVDSTLRERQCSHIAGVSQPREFSPEFTFKA